MTPERIAQIRGILGAATEDPWFADGDEGFVYNRHGLIAKAEDCLGKTAANNAEAIALARTALPEALDEVERLRAIVHSLSDENMCRLKERAEDIRSSSDARRRRLRSGS